MLLKKLFHEYPVFYKFNTVNATGIFNGFGLIFRI